MPGKTLAPPSTECGDFSHWRREHILWEDEISRWQADHQNALFVLEQISNRIVAHGAALRRLANELNDHEKKSEILRGCEDVALPPSARVTELAQAHVQHRTTHERIRRQHESAMALLHALASSLREPV